MDEVLVVGSANVDLLVRVAVPVEVGQTVIAHRMTRQPGGKGANQAVAAARLGARVRFLGAVGDDGDGRLLLDRLADEGVDVSGVATLEGTPTGLAIVTVLDSGDNSIVVVSRANHAVAADVLVAGLAAATPGTPLVLQGELTTEVTEAVLRAGAAKGLRPVVNLAPFQPLDREALAAADPLVLNESEAQALAGRPVGDATAALALSRELAGTVARSVVTTLAANGAIRPRGGRRSGYRARGSTGGVSPAAGAADGVATRAGTAAPHPGFRPHLPCVHDRRDHRA